MARAIRDSKLDAVLIGVGAAALQGAPVVTEDLDFFVRETPITERKIRRFADLLGCRSIARPGEPLTTVLRVRVPPLHVGFVFRPAGVSSFEGLRKRAVRIDVGGVPLRVALLEDVIAMKKASGRNKDRAALPILEDTLRVRREMSRRRRS